MLLLKNITSELCLQETFLKDKNLLNIKHYQTYNHLYKDEHRASGGVSVLVRKDIPKLQINIDSELKMIADKITLHKPVNICSIYIPLYDPINDNKLNKLIKRIPKPHI